MDLCKNWQFEIFYLNVFFYLFQQYVDVPETILPGNEILENDIDQLPDILDEFNRGLSEMRGFDYDNNVQIKNLDASKNELMKKRLEKKQLNKINEEKVNEPINVNNLKANNEDQKQFNSFFIVNSFFYFKLKYTYLIYFIINQF